MRTLITIFYCLTAFLLAGCGQIMTAAPATRTSVPASEIIAQLNQWDAEDMDIALCPARHPSSEMPSGEGIGFLINNFQKLKNLGVYVRWNCETKAFEITTEENQKSLCGCK